MSASQPKQWLEKAAEDLTVARLVLKEQHTAHACFLSQQCIEKSLKAYLLAKSNTYPENTIKKPCYLRRGNAAT
jgi:HEPN domain-containing protein